MKFTISEGAKRTSKQWKPREYSWSEFTDRLKAPVRTKETAADYAAAPKDQQVEIKDVGGFVGGVLRDARRSIGTVEARTLITLDADYPAPDFIETAQWQILSAQAVYTTHSHTKDKPRFRLIIPLSRPVSPDEYGAIARRAAERIGMKNFDHTTFQPERLMFWPSASSDGEYICEITDGDPMDADEMLASYNDWQDVSSWPVCPSETKVMQRASTAEDPAEKPGVIGAFCRVYSVPDAIDEYIPEEYEPADMYGDNRFTYTGGTTAGGAVIFDDGKFLYSYHDSDPAATGHCVNAFDLVRIHRFGELDAKCRESTPPESRPSFKAMLELAAGDPEVSKLMLEERVEEAQEVFSALPLPPEEEDTEWLKGIQTDKGGQAQNTLANVHHILAHDPVLRGAIAYNQFREQIVILRDLPWHKMKKRDGSGDPWTDLDDIKLLRYMERYRQHFTRQFVLDQVADVAAQNAFHPVRDYLKPLQWDGVPRVDTLLIDRIGARPDTPEAEAYVKAVTRKTLAGAVARIFDPGCKMDYMLVLSGPQGVGKSTILSDLARGWFTDSVYGIGTKDAADSIQGYWIVEMSELAALRKVEVEPIKAFISQRVDIYRAAYGRRKEEHPRQCIFVGTTNSDAFLRDETGNRRYWPVTVQGPYGRLTPGEIDQIWAEAVEIYKGGEPLFLSEELEAQARSEQERYQMEDPWTAEISSFLERPIPTDWYGRSKAEREAWLTFPADSDAPTMKRNTVTVAEIWEECFKGNPRELKKNMSALHQAMAGVGGWEKASGKIWHHGKSVRGYRRLPAQDATGSKIIAMKAAGRQ